MREQRDKALAERDRTLAHNRALATALESADRRIRELEGATA